MALDMAKYQKLFLEEATEHLSEMSRALLDLEKDQGGAESIDTIFRMAHSIKSMAASLGYDSVSELAHALEDRMETIRSAGCVSSAAELTLLFRGLEGLERMVAAVRETGEPPGPDAGLLATLAEGEGSADASPPQTEQQAESMAAPDVGPAAPPTPAVAGAGAADAKKKLRS